MRAIFCLLFITAPLWPATLVQQGRSAYTICVAKEASLSEQRGARELQRFLEEMSGARLPVTTACNEPGPFLFVGDSPALRRVIPGFDAASFGPEEFVLKTSGAHMVIAGGRQRGSMYGVYTFLERLGCRWFTPEVNRIPKQPTIQLPALDERQKPAFEYRDTNITEAEEKDWAARNKLNGMSEHLDASTGGKVIYHPFVHSFDALVPPAKYFAQHPEYFSLVDGARRAENAQLCLTNPDVLRISVERVREWIRDHPDAIIFSVSQNDNDGWCECDRCRRVEQEEGGEHSGPILRFVNALAAEIGKTNPDKLIDTLAYQYSENPPTHVRPRPNVRVRLCPIGVCVAHPYEQCPRSAYFLKNLKAWARITNQLYIWHYDTNFAHYLTPFPDFDELAADIPLYQRQGVVGLFLEGAYPPGGGSENAELRSYVTARLMWNPAADLKRDIDEFLETVYGRAAKPMRQYFDLLQREVRPAGGAGQHMWIYNLLTFSPGFLPEANRLFAQALEAAGDDAVRRRIEKARLPIEYSELVLARHYSLGDKLYSPPDVAGWQARFREFAAKLRGFGITSIREGRNLKEDEERAAATRAYPVLYLENEFSKVAVVPELSGRIVRIVDKRNRHRFPLLSEPSEGAYAAWAPYPDAGGQVAYAHPDYPAYAWDAEWKTVSHTPLEAVLAGTCSNGLALERRIRLDGEWVRTELLARNNAQDPLQVVLESRAEFDAGDIDTARVRFRSAKGAETDRLLMRPAEPPEGSDKLESQDLPSGEWSLSRPGGDMAVNRFPKDRIARATLRWTGKPNARATLAVWSPRRTLGPGEQAQIESDYR